MFITAGVPGPGRPSTIEAYPEKAEIIIAALGRGHYVTHAADLAGVTREAVERWLRLGQEHAENHQESVYATFFHKASAATAQWLDGRLQAVQSAGEKDWKASASLMGRRFRGYWSEQTNQGESGPSGITINIGVALPGVSQSSQVIEGAVVSVPDIDTE